MDQTRIPPQAVEIEASVLGAILVSMDAIELVEELTPQDFYNGNNASVFKACQELHAQGTSIDLLTVEHRLEQQNAPVDTLFLADLTANPATHSRFSSYKAILQELRISRQVLQDAQKAINERYEGSIDGYSLMDKLNATVCAPDLSNSTRSLTPSEIASREANLPKVEKFFTGNSKLDYGIYADSGMKRGQVEVTIADSGHGKTAYAEFVVELLAKQGRKIHWFQLEDSDVETAKKFAHRIPEHCDNILICDNLNEVEAIKREARSMKRKFGTDYIVIDYIQNVRQPKMSRSDSVEYASQEFTWLAKEIGVKMHLLSQATIDYNKRHGWALEPEYGDVRWSQQPKQDAHIITSVFRPSKVESLVEAGGLTNRVRDYNEELQPFDSVYVRQAKVRGGRQEYSRLHLIHGELGLKPYQKTQPQLTEAMF